MLTCPLVLNSIGVCCRQPKEPFKNMNQPAGQHIPRSEPPLDTHVVPPGGEESIPRMFDAIAHRYDLLNRLLSFGRDVAWRKQLTGQLADPSCRRVLDVATGTGDVLAALAPIVSLGIGCDMAGGMLAFGQAKIKRRRLGDTLALVRADALRLAFRDGSFDAVTIAFGIRNIPEVVGALREMHRVLRPNGRLLVLEFSLPGNRWVRFGYLFYFRRILPLVGGLISGNRHAYRYLNQSVEAFPYGDAFCDLLRAAGFFKAQAHPLTLGIATLYEAVKGDVSP